MNENTIHIVLIEDDEDDFLLLQKALAKIHQSSYVLTWIRTCSEIEPYLTDPSIAIFLVDYRLGEHTGLEIIRDAQKQGNTKPFILLTGVGNEELGIQALRSGADDYLIKSDVTPAILERAIRYAIERREIYTKQQALLLERKIRSEIEAKKDDFIGVATHELKTPVTSIKAYTQILQHRFMKEGDTKSSEMLLKMDAQLNKLISLISDLLDVTKIEGGKLSLMREEFDMNQLVAELVEELQRTTFRHTITIHGNINRLVTADKDRTGQVLTNLITNAIKYSPHSNKINVNLEEIDNSVQVCVEDFGVGIPRGKQDKVFERFFRVSGPKEDTFPGLGLGLYISSEIIKRQGGRIWVESIENVGSTFCFTLPFTPRSKRKKKV